jgi:hypothetical protein
VWPIAGAASLMIRRLPERMTDGRSERGGIIDYFDIICCFIDYRYIKNQATILGMRTKAIGSNGEAEDPEFANLERPQPRGRGVKFGKGALLHESTTPSLRVTGFDGQKRRRRRFWVLLVLSAVPTLSVILLTFLLKYYEFPEGVVGVLFFAVVIPAALICEKLGFGEFSIMGTSTIPDWLFYSVTILLVYLYSFVFVLAGRGVVSLVGRALRGKG